jgi:hypothetical protein
VYLQYRAKSRSVANWILNTALVNGGHDTILSMRCLLAAICVLFAWNASPVCAETRNARPSNYKDLLRGLAPGDRLNLAPGKYPRLYLANLRGTPDAWITITGPESGPPAAIEGESDYNTIEIENCSYLAIENLRIDSRGIPGAFGISARGREKSLTHHIRVEGNTFVGQHGGQQTDGISTKTPTWGWVIRFNKILGAGTGIYLGDSDGNQPFVAGLIEHNLIQDTLGYNMEIKHQLSIPQVPGMPLEPTSTIIRNNVFIKDDKPSPDGDRPNVLVGAFPASGFGSMNMYEIYGNYFVHNHREALFQGTGRVSLHDNIFIDGPYSYPAVVLTKQKTGPLKVALFYNNTVYTPGPGIRLGSQAIQGSAIIGNLIFASTPITGQATSLEDNITGTLENARMYVRSPSFDPAAADFYPLAGKCRGTPIDLSTFQSNGEYTTDFNGVPKTQSAGSVVFRGAYAGEGENPGWRLAADRKPPYPPLPKIPRLVWISPAGAPRAGRAELTLTGANFSEGAAVNISGEGVKVAAATIDSDTQITAKLIVSPNASGARDVTVTTSMGASNAVKLRLGSSRP